MAACFLLVTSFQPRDHCLDRNHGVVDQQAEGDDQGAERDSLKIDPEEFHRHEDRGKDERDRDRHYGARAQAEGDQADREDDCDGLPQGLHEVVHRVLNGDGLVGDERRFDPDWQVRRDLRHRLLDVAPEGQDVAACAHRDGEPDAISSIDAEHRLGRVGGPARDARDVAQANDPTVLCDEVDGKNILLGPERTRDADEDLLVLGLHDARGGDGVLGVQRGDQFGAVDPQARQLLGREFNVNALVLGPKNVDLGYIRQLEQLLADVNDVIPQLPVCESVRGEAVDDAVGVAELAVEAGADDSLGQRVADVAHLLAHLLPDARHLCRRRRVLQVDEDRGLPRARVALQVVQARRFLQLALDAVGNLLERVADRGARPCGLHHHGLDGEVRDLRSVRAGGRIRSRLPR